MGSSNSKPSPTPSCSLDSQLGDCIPTKAVAVGTTGPSIAATAPPSNIKVPFAHILSDLSSTSTLSYHMPAIPFPSDGSTANHPHGPPDMVSTVVFTGQDTRETSTVVALPQTFRSFPRQYDGSGGVAEDKDAATAKIDATTTPAATKVVRASSEKVVE